jgi:holo-ACP synthase
MTGIEALYVVDTDAVPLKLAVCELEQSHPLGRLWDMDVFCPAHGRLSRRGLGFPPRRCLICGEPAHACARAQRHPLAELLAAIQETVDGYSFCPVG